MTLPDLLTLPTLAGLGIGYALGAIPFGLIFTRIAGLGDVRAIGSGNIGATNVLRTGRKGLAFATLLGMPSKGRWPSCWPRNSVRDRLWPPGSAPSSATCSRSGSASRAARGWRR